MLSGLGIRTCVDKLKAGTIFVGPGRRQLQLQPEQRPDAQAQLADAWAAL